LAEAGGREGVPNPAVVAATHALSAIPDVSGLASDASTATDVGVGRAGGDAVAVVADTVASALTAGSAN
jgi:hypothetical protein